MNHHAPTFSILSIMLTVLSWITLIDAQYFLSFIVTILGIVSAIFAIRYYYYAGNEKKNIVNDAKKEK